MHILQNDAHVRALFEARSVFQAQLVYTFLYGVSETSTEAAAMKIAGRTGSYSVVNVIKCLWQQGMGPFCASSTAV